MSQKVFKLYLQRLTAQDRKTIIVQTQTNQHELHKDYIALTVEFAGPAARAMIFFGRWASSRSQASGLPSLINSTISMVLVVSTQALATVRPGEGCAIWKAWEPILEAASLRQFVAFVLNLPTSKRPKRRYPQTLHRQPHFHPAQCHATLHQREWA